MMFIINKRDHLSAILSFLCDFTVALKIYCFARIKFIGLVELVTIQIPNLIANSRDTNR